MKNALLSLTLLAILTSIPNAAFAYIDPGTGSLIIQSIAAASVGLVFYVKMYWFKIRSFFTRKSKTDEVTTTETTNDEK